MWIRPALKYLYPFEAMSILSSLPLGVNKALWDNDIASGFVSVRCEWALTLLKSSLTLGKSDTTHGRVLVAILIFRSYYHVGKPRLKLFPFAFVQFKQTHIMVINVIKRLSGGGVWSAVKCGASSRARRTPPSHPPQIILIMIHGICQRKINHFPSQFWPFF